MIDTGMNREECLHVMLTALERLHVDLRYTDFFVTHLHADHLGQVASLATATSAVYFNHKEAQMVNSRYSGSEQWWQKSYDFFLSNGFPENELKKSLQSHPARQYGLKHAINFSTLKEGDTIQIQNGYVKLFRGNMRLNVGRYGSYTKQEESEIEEVNTENNLSDAHYEQERRYRPYQRERSGGYRSYGGRRGSGGRDRRRRY